MQACGLSGMLLGIELVEAGGIEPKSASIGSLGLVTSELIRQGILGYAGIPTS
jgi:hypothetical protein